MVRIRQETLSDHAAVYTLVKEAFESAAHADGNEADLVEALRRSEAFIPELSLVAEMETEAGETIVGYILFTEAHVGGQTVLALAPLAVLPAFQRQGVGTALIREGHRIAGQLGYPYSVVLGSEQYYPRAGYQRAECYGIRPPFDVPADNFMAYALQGDAKPMDGVLEYAKEFGI